MSSATQSSPQVPSNAEHGQNEQALFSGDSVLEILRLILAGSPLPEVLPIYRTNKDIVIQVVPTNGYQPIVMGVDKPPFNDPRVRRAMRLLCDRPAMNKIVLGELNVPPSNDHPIPPASPMFMDQKIMQANVDDAKKLLTEAGYANGLDVELMAWTGRAGLIQEALAHPHKAKAARDVAIFLLLGYGRALRRGEVVDARYTFFVLTDAETGEMSRMGLGFARDFCKQIEQDIPIWESKIYRDRPQLARGEGAITEFRSWARQSYE